MITTRVARDNSFFSKLILDNTLTKKASLNALALALDYGARLLVGFIITPLLVTGLGDFFYGTWRILERIVGYISPASGRATQALKWTLASKQASADFEEKRRYVGCTLAVWVFFLPIIIILGGLLVWFVPSWINAPRESFWSIRLACGILVASLIMTSLVEIPRSVLEGENLGYKRMGLSAILVFVGGGLTWLALHFDTGMAGVAVAALITILLTGLVFLMVARAYAPWLGVAKPTFSVARQFLSLSWWFLAWHFIMRMMLGSDVIVLGVFDSVEMVTTYSLTKYVPETLITLVSIMVFGVTPGLGGIIGSGDLPKADEVRNEIMILTWLVITVLGSTILLWNWAFIRLWVGQKHYAGSVPTLLIVVAATQFVLIRNDANIIDLTLRIRSKVLLGALSQMLSLVAAAILVIFFKLGITGLCLGLILGRSIISMGYPIMVGRFLRVSLCSQLKGSLRPAFITVLLFLLASKLGSLLFESNWLAAEGWIELILSVGVTLGALLFLTFYAGLSYSQRRKVLQRVTEVMSI